MVLFRLRLTACRLSVNRAFLQRSHHTAGNECRPNITKLNERKVLRVKGKDSSKFLQGIITNDINFLVEGHAKILYTMFLNAQGRVLYDAFLHSIPGQSNDYLLECDANSSGGITEHLKRYKLRAKIAVTNASDEFEAWALFSCGGDVNDSIRKHDQSILISQDPRIDKLGMRMVTPLNKSPIDLLGIEDCNSVDSAVYKMHRYTLGIAEGVHEIPSGNALPLEYNLAINNGVSFNKGCYIGQELTARTHHTGVIRKRLMPIQLKDQVDDSAKDLGPYPQFESQTPIKTTTGKSAGRLCVMLGQYGLGVLRLNEVFNSEYLTVCCKSGNSFMLSTRKPNWWPTDLKY